MIGVRQRAFGMGLLAVSFGLAVYGLRVLRAICEYTKLSAAIFPSRTPFHD